MKWPVALRADADAEIGAGHFMRCLTLAEGCLARGGQPVIFTTTISPGLRERATAVGVDVATVGREGSAHGSSELISWVSDHRGAWVVLDGYGFDGDFQLAVGRAGSRVMVIDDYPRLSRYHAELLLDQNFGAEEKQYPVAEGCRTLLGPGYALLRPEFVTARSDNREHRTRALRVLVTLGAADPDDRTSMVIEALASVASPGLDVTVVIGATNPRATATSARAERAGLRVMTDVRDMSQLMAEADVAVSSAGTTLWELCCMGLPTITMIIAENQRPAAVALEQAGATVNLGWHETVSAEDVTDAVGALCASQKTRARMGAVGQSLVDGRGVERVLDEMLIEVG